MVCRGDIPRHGPAVVATLRRRRLHFVLAALLAAAALRALGQVALSEVALPPLRRFAAVSPCSNPKSQLNAEAWRELAGAVVDIQAEASELQVKLQPPAVEESRWFVELPPSDAAMQRLRQLRLPNSVRIVALFAAPPAGLGRNSSSAAELAAWAAGAADWDHVFDSWVAAGNTWPPQSCHVALRRRKSSRGSFAEDLSLPLRRELALRLEVLHGWVPEVQRRAADLEVHVTLAADGRLLLEVPLLVQRRALGLAGGLPRPGMKQVEAWAMARSVEPKPGELILDPMCGKGTLLAEAANWWPEARYVGCDADSSQLEASHENYAYLKVEVESYLANASELGGLPLQNSSVSKIMTAPPWDRQFVAEGGLAKLYPQLLREFRRVLRPNGTMVLLASEASVEQLVAAVLQPESDADGSGLRWCVVTQRRFAITDETVGVLLVARRLSAQEQPDRVVEPGPLWWEEEAVSGLKGVRRYWSRLRAGSLPTLRPFLLE